MILRRPRHFPFTGAAGPARPRGAGRVLLRWAPPLAEPWVRRPSPEPI